MSVPLIYMLYVISISVLRLVGRNIVVLLLHLLKRFWFLRLPAVRWWCGTLWSAVHRDSGDDRCGTVHGHHEQATLQELAHHTVQPQEGKGSLPAFTLRTFLNAPNEHSLLARGILRHISCL